MTDRDRNSRLRRSGSEVFNGGRRSNQNSPSKGPKSSPNVRPSQLKQKPSGGKQPKIKVSLPQAHPKAVNLNVHHKVPKKAHQKIFHKDYKEIHVHHKLDLFAREPSPEANIEEDVKVRKIIRKKKRSPEKKTGFKPYTMRDYRKLNLDIKMGGLRVNKKSTAYLKKVEMREKMLKLAKDIRKQHAEELVQEYNSPVMSPSSHRSLNSSVMSSARSRSSPQRSRYSSRSSRDSMRDSPRSRRYTAEDSRDFR